MVRLLRAASSFTPASVTSVWHEDECGEVLEGGQFLHPRVRHLRGAQVECGEALEGGQFLQPPRPSPVSRPGRVW